MGAQSQHHTPMRRFGAPGNLSPQAAALSLQSSAHHTSRASVNFSKPYKGQKCVGGKYWAWGFGVKVIIPHNHRILKASFQISAGREGRYKEREGQEKNT